MANSKLVPAVLRAAALLDRVTSFPGRTLSELSRDLALPKSSVHALCRTLCHLNLLSETDARFFPGEAQWTYRHGLVSEFNHIVAEDQMLSRHTITLSVLEGSDVVYQVCHNSPAPLSISFRKGMHLPAAFTATGKAILAALPKTAQDAFLSRPIPEAMTRLSIASVSALRAQISETVARGFSIDQGEIREGMACIGAAVCDGTGQPVAAVALSLTTAEAEPDVITSAGALMVSFAQRLGQP